MAVMVGGVLGFTVNTKLVDAVSVPSLTVTVMVEVPLAACNRRDSYSAVCTASTKGDVCVWNQRCI